MGVRPRGLDGRIEKLRFIRPDRLAAAAGLLVLRRLSGSFQLVNASLIGAQSRQPTRVYSIKADVGVVGDTDHGLEGLFHSLRDRETAFGKIKNGFPSGQPVLFFNGVE